MVQISTVQDPVPSGTRARRSRAGQGAWLPAILATLLTAGAVGGLLSTTAPRPTGHHEQPAADRVVAQVEVTVPQSTQAESVAEPDAEAPPQEHAALLESPPQNRPGENAAEVAPATPFAVSEPAAPEEPAASVEKPRVAQTVPLPVPRPPELRRVLGSDMPRRPVRRVREVAAPAPVEDTRSFFDKLFGVEQGPKPAPALAYAALEAPALDATPRRRLSPIPVPDVAGAGIAIYDITARVVHLPSGEKLEAHSGLGATMDDPRFVHVRMRGATPPGTYDLSEREAPFHGVRAIRLNPVGGAEAIHGRTGILAHTYMLGPSGASNGCVSFRDYDKFLQAYLRGEVRRLVVVPGRGMDTLPAVAAATPSGLRVASAGP